MVGEVVLLYYACWTSVDGRPVLHIESHEAQENGDSYRIFGSSEYFRSSVVQKNTLHVRHGSGFFGLSKMDVLQKMQEDAEIEQREAEHRLFIARAKIKEVLSAERKAI